MNSRTTHASRVSYRCTIALLCALLGAVAVSVPANARPYGDNNIVVSDVDGDANALYIAQVDRATHWAWGWVAPQAANSASVTVYFVEHGTENLHIAVGTHQQRDFPPDHRIKGVRICWPDDTGVVQCRSDAFPA